MTANQIKYAEYLENKRHNLAGEQISTREVVVQETNAETNRMKYEEDVRHNMRTEKLTDDANKENVRHNMQSEGIARDSLEETTRHNMRTEDLTQQDINEKVRHNQESESIGRTQAQAALISAGAAVKSAEAAMVNAQASTMNAETNRERMINDRYVSQGELGVKKRQLIVNQDALDVQKRGQNMQLIGSIIGTVTGAATKLIGTAVSVGAIAP